MKAVILAGGAGTRLWPLTRDRPAALLTVVNRPVIEHLLDSTAGIRELIRVLKPGGTLVLSTDNSRNYVSQGLNLPRTALVRALNLRGRRTKVSFPHRSFTREEVLSTINACNMVFASHP